MSENDEWLKTGEVARRTGLSVDTIRRMVDADLLDGFVTLGKHRRVSAESVDRYLERRNA